MRCALVLAAGALLAGAPAARAQGFAGAAVEEQLRVPLVGLRVTLVQLRGEDSVVVDSGRTERDGLFQLFGRGPGRYLLRFGSPPVTWGPVDSVSADSMSARQYAIPVLRMSEEKPFFEFHVTRQVATMPGSAFPRYPDQLRRGHVRGSVLAQFVVDTTGRAEMTTFKILRSTHPDFAPAVRDAVRRMRYRPAELAGVKVRQVVQQPFDFSVSRTTQVVRVPGVVPPPEDQ